MPASSKMDPLLAKAKPISGGGSASGVTELTRGKKPAQQKQQLGTAVRRCERNSPADTKVSAEGGGGGTPGTRAEIPLQPMEKTMVRQAVSLQPMEDDGGAEIPPVARGGPHTGAGGCPKEAVTPWKAHAGASSLQDLWTRGERSPHQGRFAGRTCDLMGDPRWSSLFLKVCTPWEGPTLEQLVKNCSPWEGLMLEKLVRTVSCGRGPTLEQGQNFIDNLIDNYIITIHVCSLLTTG
ncbi:EH domain-containing protein 4 [Grus japonensis]|uniref:EH domain-containing protein 4 n=1 Tax=Grus japonensis TaxID=30415 RepID=A0ABC9W9A0_GRUJA